MRGERRWWTNGGTADIADQMKPLCVASLALLGLLGTAEARLGESVEEIASRTGSGTPTADFEYPNELVVYKVRKVGGFDVVSFMFFRTKDRSGESVGMSDFSGKCVGVHYLKFYDNWDDVEMTPKDAGVLLAKNYPDASTSMQIVKSEGISGDVAVRRLWDVKWTGSRGEEAVAGVSASERDFSPIFSVLCWSAEMAKFYENKTREEQKRRSKPASGGWTLFSPLAGGFKTPPTHP